MCCQLNAPNKRTLYSKTSFGLKRQHSARFFLCGFTSLAPLEIAKKRSSNTQTNLELPLIKPWRGEGGMSPRLIQQLEMNEQLSWIIMRPAVLRCSHQNTSKRLLYCRYVKQEVRTRLRSYWLSQQVAGVCGREQQGALLAHRSEQNQTRPTKTHEED